VQAAVATLAVLAVLGLAWVTAEEPVPVGPAQAAAAGGAPAVGVRHTAVCKARYQVRRDSGSAFDAALTLTNIGEQALTGWQLKFAFPGSQRLSGTAATITQRGRLVVVHPSKAATLHPGRSIDVALRGSYRTTNPLPLAFLLNGRACKVEVLGGTTTVTAEDDAGGEAAGDALGGGRSGTEARKASRARGHSGPAAAGSGAAVAGTSGSGAAGSGTSASGAARGVITGTATARTEASPSSLRGRTESVAV
jgi:serine/threonine-protein kinase